MIYMCFFDFSDAFDIVNHWIPCEKLMHLGYLPKLWVESRVLHGKLLVPSSQSSPVALPKTTSLAHITSSYGERLPSRSPAMCIKYMSCPMKLHYFMSSLSPCQRY